MGCAGSSPADQDSHQAGQKVKEHDVALDGPPDFGVDEYYEVRKMLGEGGSGQTWLCLDRRQRKSVAVKFIRRPVPKLMLPMLMHEIKIQAELGDGHVNLVSANAVLLTETHLGIVMECASGGNLTAYVTEKWDSSDERNGLFCSEDEARYFFRQFIDAVEFLHLNHVAHRDLKLDNIVLDGKTPPRLKVCDFGFSKYWGSDSSMYTQIGTPVYMSPQLISAKNSKTGYDASKADIWACGVLLFVMLHGMFPYDHPDHPDPNSSDAHVEVWMQQIKMAWRDCPNVPEVIGKMSPECQDLLDKLFDRNEARRITLKGIKKHRWMRKELPPEFQAPLNNMLEIQARIKDRCLQDESQGLHTEFAKTRDAELEEIISLAGTEASLSKQEKLRIVDFTRPLPQLSADRSRKLRDEMQAEYAAGDDDEEGGAHGHGHRQADAKAQGSGAGGGPDAEPAAAPGGEQSGGAAAAAATNGGSGVAGSSGSGAAAVGCPSPAKRGGQAGGTAASSNGNDAHAAVDAEGVVLSEEAGVKAPIAVTAS